MTELLWGERRQRNPFVERLDGRARSAARVSDVGALLGAGESDY